MHEELVGCCQGLTADQIEQSITMSVHGDAVTDPAALALYLEALAAGEVGTGDVTEIPETDEGNPAITEAINMDQPGNPGTY